MTSEVRTPESTEARTVFRIGLPLVLASVLASTLGIVIAQFLDDLGDGIMAVILGGEAVLYNNRVEITGATDLAWAGGFLLCLIIGFLALFGYPTQRDSGIPKLVLLWTLLQVLRQALGQVVPMPFADDSQLSLAYATFDAPPGLDMVIAAAGVIGLLLIALASAAAFLAFAPHRTLVSTAGKRLNLALWLALIPAATSAFLAIPYFLPDTGSLVVTSLPLTAVMFIATVAAAPGTTTVQGPYDVRKTPWPVGLGAFLIVLLIFYLGVLEGGVNLDPRLWG